MKSQDKSTEVSISTGLPQRLLATLGRAPHLAMIVSDELGRIVVWNQAAERMFGWSETEMLGRRMPTEFIKDTDLAEADLKQAVDEDYLVVERELLKRSGQLMLARIFVSSVKNDNGTLIGVLSCVEDITENRRAREELEQAKHQYRSLQDNLPVGIFRSTPSGKLLYVNDACIRMYGYDSAEEMLQREANSYYPDPDSRQKMLKQLEEHGQIKASVNRQFRKDGSVFWTSSNITAVRDENGKILYFDGMDEDITERYQAAEALRASEERLQSTIRSLRDLLFVMDRDGVITNYYQPNRDPSFHVPPDEFLGKHFKDVFPAEVSELMAGGIARTIETDEPQELEYSLTMRGAVHFYGAKLSVLKDSTGDTQGITVVARDVTVQKMAELALRNSEERNRMLLEHVPAVITLFSYDGTRLYSNRQAAAIHETTPEELIGTSMWDGHPQEQADAFMANVRRVINSGQPYAHVAKSVIRGSEHIWDTNLVPFRDGEGTVTSALVIAVDITSRLQAEEAQRRSEALNLAVIENSPMGVSVRRPNGQLVQYNRAWMEIWGMSEADVQADLTRERGELSLDVSDSYLGEWWDRVRKIYESGGNLHIPEVLVPNHRSRGNIWVSQFFYALKNDNGEVEQVVIVTEDVTDRKLSEMRIKENEERYRLLAENSLDVITRHLPDTTLLYVSPASSKVLGYSPKEMIGHMGFEFIHPDDRKRVIEAQDEALKHGDFIHQQFRVFDRHGRTRWAETNAQALRDQETGEVREIIGVHRDITDRIESQQALQRAHDELEFRVKSRTRELAEVNEALRVEQESLKQKNITLQELLTQIESSRKDLAAQAQANIDRIVMPYVRALESGVGARYHLIRMLKDSLSEISSSFARDLGQAAGSLTPREMEVCDMIRRGLTSKQIADLLSTSVQTVNKQRSTIRRKLGLTGKDVNLTSHLNQYGKGQQGPQ